MTLLENTSKLYYNALLKKDLNYEGVFCRSTCPARKSKFDNCEFSENAQDNLTASYCRGLEKEIVGNEKIFRAIANINDVNQLVIIISCHRIINHNGEIGGYGGGKYRKEWLLEHEKNHA